MIQKHLFKDLGVKRKKRWSKLQKALYALIEPELNFQIHCSVYRMQSQRGSTDLPRYWITLDKEVIFDYPRQFLDEKVGEVNLRGIYPYDSWIPEISDLIREYISSPREGLAYKRFDLDDWGLTGILKAADRRIGAEGLKALKRKSRSPAVQKIVSLRLAKEKEREQ